jgi:hypothetical protein
MGMNMVNTSINKLKGCPVCGGALAVTQLSCRRCDVTVGGSFEPSRFDRLTADQSAFLETFLRCRGVIRDVEAALGISYPTVRARLDGLLAALDLDTPAPVDDPVDEALAARRREVLQDIDSGRISPEAGLRILETLK